MIVLAGTGALVRLILRRDRIRLALWIAALSAVSAATAASLAKVLPTPELRVLFAGGITTNPAVVAMIGPMFDPTTIGGLTAWRLGSLAAVATALMSLLTVVRHTRAEEEAGRRELIGSTAVDRNAQLAAALIVVGGADLMIAALVAAGLCATGLPAAGSIALGLSFGCTGWVFAAIAALAAQLVENARTAGAIAGAALGAAFLARAIGDSSGASWLSWASPVGWAQRIRPFAGERWWLCALAAAVAAVIAAAAHALSARRDLGAGLFAARPGRPAASRWLRSPLALAWRLQRTALVAWTTAFAIIGAALGSVAHSIADLANTSPRLRLMISAIGGGGGDIVHAYFTAMLGILALVASGQGLQAILRLRAEEEDGRAEPLLAASVGRIRWAGGHLVFAVLGPAVALSATGAAAGIVHGEPGDLAHLVANAAAQLPAVWVIVGAALALFGAAPRLARASWGVLAACALVGQLGPLLQLPRWVIAASPFSHTPGLPAGAVHAAPLLVLTAVAVGLGAIGLLCFARRDLS